MRVGLVIYGSLDILTGGFIYDRELVDYLRGEGTSVEVYPLPWRNYVAHLTDNFSFRFIKQLRDSKVDILLQDELNHPSLITSNSLFLRSREFPVVSIVHHLRSSELRSNIANRLYQKVEKQYLKSTDGLIFNSHTTRKSVHNIGIKNKPFVVAHPGRNFENPGVERGFIRERAEQRGPIKLLFVGSLIPRKELHTLLEAVLQIPKNKWTLKVVGSLETDKHYAQSVIGSLKRLDLENNVELLGSMTRKDLEMEYMKSHVLAVPSSYEGFGIVYLESMGFGCPSLATTAGAAHEIITDGLNGFLVSPGDTNAIAEKISLVADDRKVLAQMGIAALDRFTAHPTWRQSCEKIYDFMKEMVHTNHV
ncbi:MAG: glycosyltransferase family 4 protein [Pseudomonadota bacterium]